jgi:hypothetical protein
LDPIDRVRPGDGAVFISLLSIFEASVDDRSLLSSEKEFHINKSAIV